MIENETFGRVLLNQQLPEAYKVTGELTKKSFNKSMAAFAKKAPMEYGEAISKMKHLGDQIATTEGLSVGLEDIEPDYKERDRVMKPFTARFTAAKTDDKRRGIVEEAQEAMQESAKTHSGSLTFQVRSGARGNAVQHSNMVSAVGYARDPSGRAEPWLIRRSYAEGLKPSDYYATSNQSLMDVIKTHTEVSVPGEMAKKLVANMSAQVITEEDCGTHNGILMDSKSPDVVDRFLARDEGSFKRNTLITPVNQGKLAKSKHQILVRSPMSCEAGDGVCKRCQGLDEKGKMHHVGTHVGIRAAQAMAEPLTQFALNAKHGGRTLKSDRFQVHGIQGFRQILETPQQFINKATLSNVDGTVKKIEDAPQGGHFVTVVDEKHYVTPNLGVVVKVGEKVERGDALSEGIPRPDEVVSRKGLGSGRLYVVNTIHNIYKNQGKDLDRRHVELLARSNMNHVRVLKDPSNTYIKGDILLYNNLRSDLSKNTKHVALKDALGEVLGKEYFQYSVGTRVTPATIAFLKSQKVKEVWIAPRAPSIEFVMKPATSAPKYNPDWLARMSHQGLKETIQRAATQGDVSNIHGTHPVPAYAYGAEFGEGEEGRY
jgi:DNA-directed RNA polymerase subunit beta'